MRERGWGVSRNYGSIKKKRLNGAYFLGLAAAFGLVFALGLGFSSLTGFIGALQQTMSHVSHPHGSSTKMTSPHSSHLYFSPFFFAKNFTLKIRLQIQLF